MKTKSKNFINFPRINTRFNFIASDISEDEENIRTQGYLYKIKNGQLKKTWVKLIQKDLYLYDNDKDAQHKRLINLSSVFVQENKPTYFADKQFYKFSLISNAKVRRLYTDKHEDYLNWLVNLRKVTGYSDVGHNYEFIKVLSEGKFGIVKLAKHKQTERNVAIKVIQKENFPKGDYQLIRSEIEVLKIAQHPNIVQLYDLMENKSKLYISKNKSLPF
jgi:hypothetical protein